MLDQFKVDQEGRRLVQEVEIADVQNELIEKQNNEYNDDNLEIEV